MRGLISRIILIVVGLIFMTSVLAPIEKPLAAEARQIRISILYDHYVFLEGTKAGWGFSCLVEGPEKTILFDAGNQCTTLFHNVNKLGVTSKDVDLVVVSHKHRTHTGGLCPFLEQNKRVTVYVPASGTDYLVKEVERTGARAKRVDEPIEICEDAFLTGEMGFRTKEQSLILNTAQGLVVVTGCAHPGIIKTLERAKAMLSNRIYLALGGFHLLGKSEEEIGKIITEFRRLKVMKVGPTACTGHRNIELFREEYGDAFVQMGVGKTLRIE